MTFIAADFSDSNRKVLVTPSFFPKNGNFRGFEVRSAPYFSPSFGVIESTKTHVQTMGHIDWLTIKQTHYLPDGEVLPILAGGCVMTFDADGVLEYDTLKKLQIEGSYDSKCYVRAYGTTVEFSGNPARWGRMDNVFGYGFGQSLLIVNQILASVGLPPFDVGRRMETKNRAGEIISIWTGATISRIDFTQNYCTGSPDCQRRLNIEPPCRFNIEPGLVAEFSN